MHRYFLAFFSLSLLAGSGWPNTIVVGEHFLQANLPAQEIEILVTGDTPVSGLDLFVQMGDGGPELADVGLPRGHRGPRLTNVELIQGTIFDGTGESPTNIGVPELSQIAMYTLALVGAVPSVPAQGTLAKLTVDTTGMYHGSWDLLLSGVLPYAELNGPYDTNFAGMPADIENGHVTIVVGIGDYNGSGHLDAQDIDQLAEAIRVGSDDPKFDVTEDGVVNGLDHRYWVGSIARTFFGDANLDGEFNSSDMVQVFASGKYETGQSAGWAEGNWNADGVFDTSDMVAAFVDGGYEQGSKTNAAAVPEPASAILLFVSLIVIATHRRRFDP